MLLIHRLLAIDNLLDNNYHKFIPILCKEYCLSHGINNIQLEYCYYINFKFDHGDDSSDGEHSVAKDGRLQLSAEDIDKMLWLLSETFEPHLIHINQSFFNEINGNHKDYSNIINDGKNDTSVKGNSLIIECGPRLAFSTAWSSNCLSMFHACGITNINRIERSRRYRLQSALQSPTSSLSKEDIDVISSFLYDRMTECIYPEPLQSFNPTPSESTADTDTLNGITSTTIAFPSHSSHPVVSLPLSSSTSSSSHTIPLLENGISELIKVNQQQGLGFDDVDLEFYYNIFINILKRNPTDVECFDLGK